MKSADTSFFLSTRLSCFQGYERVWCFSFKRGAKQMAIGFDNSSVVLKFGQETPPMSMDSTGKVIWAKHQEILQVTY